MNLKNNVELLKSTRKRRECQMYLTFFFPYIFLTFVPSELSWCIKGVNDDNELTFTVPFFLKSPKGHYKQI